MPSITIRWDHTVKTALVTTAALPNLPTRHLVWGELALAIAIIEGEGYTVTTDFQPADVSPEERLADSILGPRKTATRLDTDDA